MTTVWVVTDGGYSDKYVVSVCSSEENAKEFIESKLGDDYYDTEIDALLDKAKQRLKVAVVDMRKDGSLIEDKVWFPHCCTDLIEECAVDFSSYGSYGGSRYRPEDKGYRFSMWARDEEHAIKIANERRTRMIAEGTWPDQEVKA